MIISKLDLDSVRVVVTDRAAHVDDAMKLAHDGLVENGYLKPSPSGRRFAPAYLNPGTRFIVAYAGDEAIGTATLVADGPFGLPSDRSFAEEIDELRAETKSLTEVSALAISPAWRRHTRLILGYILGTVVRFNGDQGGSHRAIYAVLPRQAAFMSLILMGERTFGPRPLMGAPANLIVTGIADDWRFFFSHPDAPKPRKLIAEYALDPSPTWLENHPPSGEWQRVLLPLLLTESNLEARLRLQMAVLQAHKMQNALESPEPLIV